MGFLDTDREDHRRHNDERQTWSQRSAIPKPFRMIPREDEPREQDRRRHEEHHHLPRLLLVLRQGGGQKPDPETNCGCPIDVRYSIGFLPFFKRKNGGAWQPVESCPDGPATTSSTKSIPDERSRD